METNRQKKVGQLMQEEFAEIFRKQSAEIGQSILISVTEVRVSSDLSIAKLYLSIYPKEHRTQLMKEINLLKPRFRKMIGEKLAKQLRIIPNLNFYLDDTLDTAEKLEQALKGLNDTPIL